MSLRSLLRHEVTVLRPPGSGVDAYGNPTGDLVADDEPTRCFVQFNDDSETPDAQGRDTSRAKFTVYFEPDADIDPTCNLQWGTRVIEVLGVVEAQRPGSTHHLRVAGQEIR